MIHIIAGILALTTLVMILWGPAIFGAVAVYLAVAFPDFFKRKLDDNDSTKR